MLSFESFLTNLPVIFRSELVLAPTQSSYGNAHPLSVCEAIVKGITEQAGLSESEKVRVLFNWPNKRVASMRVEFGQTITLQISLFAADNIAAQCWVETARHYFDDGQPGRNFKIVSVSDALPYRFQTLKIDKSLSVTEVCLDFLTPFPFQTVRSKARFWLDAEGFSKALSLRIKKLFELSVALPESSIRLLPYYWSYCQIAHASNSQAGHIKYLNGCVGRLYIKGGQDELQAWIPWLLLAEQLGMGGNLSFGLGRFKLLLESPAFFQAKLTNPNALEKIIIETLESYDEALPALATEPSGVNEAALAVSMANQIKSGWHSDAYQAFCIPKPHGGFRIAEKTNFSERVLQRHMLSMLREVLDKTFAEESIGFRKGLSRNVVIERIHQALKEGYDYVLESDITDFFPSVDLSILQSQLDHILPVNDHLLRETLTSILSAPRILSGRVEQRLKGLAVGSPLSPLLANVYLDTFDEQIKEQGVRLIRFADDFIILTRGLEAAEALFSIAENSLQQLGLKLNLEKTAIHKIEEGFTFLGIRFGMGADIIHDDFPDTLRKPVYITEPFVFLGVDANCLEVRQHASVLTRIPLKRISEILTMGPCCWSSTLVAQCVDANIPIVLTTGFGKHVATLGGDSAHHYEVAYRHAAKFESMDASQKLLLAQEFATGKLHNYTSLIRQRYRPGNHILLRELQKIIDDMWAAEDVLALRGFEGIAARKVFPQLNHWIEVPGFHWEGRKRRPPDRLNSLLNLAYHLLFCRINVVVRGEGLNPYLGVLHEANDRYEALVCDIQELFRPHMDRLVVKLLNLSIVNPDDFKQNNFGFWLTKEAKARVLEAFSRELDHEPLAHNRATLNEAIALQVRSLRKFFLEDTDIQFFRW